MFIATEPNQSSLLTTRYQENMKTSDQRTTQRAEVTKQLRIKICEWPPQHRPSNQTEI